MKQWTILEARDAQSALSILLRNLGFKDVRVSWPTDPKHNEIGTRSEIIDLTATFETTKQQQKAKYFNSSSTPRLHTQIFDALDYHRPRDWVKFGAGSDYTYQFRVYKAERKHPMESGIVSAVIEAKKHFHSKPKADLPSREPKWT